MNQSMEQRIFPSLGLSGRVTCFFRPSLAPSTSSLSLSLSLSHASPFLDAAPPVAASPLPPLSAPTPVPPPAVRFADLRNPQNVSL